jgi:DnaJ family protein C protein 28
MVDKGEEQIRRAMEDGQFDNLPGKGKPLNLDENPFEDPEWHLANKVLRDGGFSLPWIESRKEIEARLEDALAALSKAWLTRGSDLGSGYTLSQVDAEWKRAEDTFRSESAEINKLIFLYNLVVPTYQVQRLLINAEREIRKVTGSDRPE